MRIAHCVRAVFPQHGYGGLERAATAFGLGRPLADYLVGKSLPPQLIEQLRAVIESERTIEEIISLHAVYTGPEEVIVAAKIRPSPQLNAAELSSAMDRVDQALHDASPFVADVYIDVTSHRADDGDSHA